MQPQNIKLLKETIETITKGNITRSDFVAALKEIRKELIERIDSYLLKTQKDILGAVKDKIDMIESDLNKSSDVMEKMSSQKMEEIMEDCMKEISRVEAMIPEVDFTEVEKKIDNAVLEIESKIPTLPEELKAEAIRDKIESLKGDERLDKSAIKGLEDEIAELRKEMSTRLGGGGSRRVYQPYVQRFTHLTDGVTKTFYLTREPLKTDTIEVSGTDFPIILDPTVDFTVAGKAITLTDSVPAPSEGATLIIKYYA